MAVITAKDLTIAYDQHVVMHDVSFEINEADIFIIMGGSGCGKSTLLSVLTGLKKPSKGTINFDGIDFWPGSPENRVQAMRRAGILYQSGALWTSMTLAENIALPMRLYTKRSESDIQKLVSYKLDLVGLTGFEDYYPSEISGGMKKRAGLARALSLDPKIVFFDEPSAGLDPISSKNLDELIVEIKENLHTTVVMVTHELPSLLSVGTNSIFIDAQQKMVTARGAPKDLYNNPPNDAVKHFLTRGEK